MKKDVLTIFFVILIFSISLPPIFAESDMVSSAEYDDDFYKGEVQWAEKCIMQGSASTVKVIDHDMNKAPEKPELFDIRVWSDFDLIGNNFTVTETGNDTGVFQGTVYFSTYDKTNHRIQSFAEDTVYAKYVDTTLPNMSIDSEMIGSFTMLGLSVLEYQKHNHARYPSIVLYDNPCVIEYREKYQDTYAGQFTIFYPSPLKQIEMGLQLDEIACKENLVLVQRYDGSPACVKSETIEKLIQRHWITLLTVHEIALKTMNKNLDPECSQHSMHGIQDGLIDDICRLYLLELSDEHKSKMTSQGYFFDQDQKVWVKDGYPDVMMSIVDYYLQIPQDSNSNMSDDPEDLKEDPTN